MGTPAGAVWLPRQGPVDGRCDRCRAWGQLVVEHRMVWGVLGQVPDHAPQVRDGCPVCQDKRDPWMSSRLVARTSPPASLAGQAMKFSATEDLWLECVGCGHDAPCHFWAWVACKADGCTRESRARLEMPGVVPREGTGQG